MKKIIVLSAVITALALGFLVSCEQETEPQEIIVTNFPPEKTFSAPASVSVQDPDPSNSSNIRVHWKGVPYAESYVLYIKYINGGNEFIDTLVFTTPISINGLELDSTRMTYYTSIPKTLPSGNNYNSNYYSAGICAVSHDGIKSAITWSK